MGKYNGMATDLTYETVPEGYNFGGKVAVFNGSSSIVDIGNNFDMTTSNNYSFVFWLQPTSGSPFSKGAYGEAGYRYSSNSHYFCVASSANAWSTDLKVPADTNWHQIAIVKTGTNFVVYYNGVQFSTLTTSHVGPVSRNFIFGKMSNLDSGDYYNGKMANFRIYDASLTADEVLRLYKREKSS